MAPKGRLFAAFAGDAMLRESGRLPHAILFPFLFAGYQVYLDASLPRRLAAFYGCEESSLPDPAARLLSRESVMLTSSPPDDPRDFLYVYDEPDPTAHRLPWRKRVRVGFDLFAPHRIRAPIIAPYPVHSAQAEWLQSPRLERLRGEPRRVRVLFAGDSKGYVRNRVRYPAPKLPRLAVLNSVRRGISEDVIEVSGAQDIAALCAERYVDRVVLSDSGTGIPPSEWMPNIARADFFLCAPGIVMPMCHNLIEAMAVGTIPILNYPEWMDPDLTHLRDCLVFEGEDDLVAKVRLALAMPSRQIADMRANVVRYYEANLRPDVLVGAVEAREERDITVLLHTELNTARNAAKLNRNSVVITGPKSDSVLRRIVKAIDGVFAGPR